MEMETVGCCPTCGRPDTLIALGTRRDHPHRWLPWVTTLTHLYLCERGDGLVALSGHATGEEQWPPT